MKRSLDKLEYVAYIRDSYPQTRYSLAQWNALYERYECTICRDSWTVSTEQPLRMIRTTIALPDGNNEETGGLIGVKSHQLIGLLRTYAACVNLTVGREATRVHVCNFLPLIIGSRLDIRLRYGAKSSDDAFWWTLPDFLQHDLVHFGQAFLFGRFWVFNSFINTDSRQCHRYRKHTNASSSVIRMYIYDRTGKGNMLFLTEDGTLRMRDKFRREVTLFHAGNTRRTTAAALASDERTNEVLKTFFDDIDSEMSVLEFFRCCRDYMSRGIGWSDDTAAPKNSFHIPNTTLEIDHINNKRVSNAPALYSSLISELLRSLLSTTTRSEAAWKLCVTRYANTSQQANLLSFISRRTSIRREWSEIMKRQMKSEIRAEKTLGANIVASSSPTIVGSSRSRNDLAATSAVTARWKFRAADTTQDVAKMEQQFLCSKVHTDVEYDNESVKRMKVVNLNAMKCLKMPVGFARFFSYFNVGNIGNAGRVMNRTHAMRESFVCDVDRSLEKIGTWLRSYLAAARSGAKFRATGSTIFALNEKPVRRSDRSLNLRNENSADSLNFWSIFSTLKYLEPGVVVTVTQLRAFDRDDRDYFVNIRLTNGVPLIPVNVRGDNDASNDDPAIAAAYCDTCLTYYAVDALTVRLPLANASVVDDDARFSALPRCASHIWCSRHELTLYELSERLERPKLHEIACHGLLSVGAFPYATDVSKLIVAINAHKRALELRVTNSRGGEAIGVTEMRGYLNDCADRAWSNLSQNGKITRLFHKRSNEETVSSRLTPRNAIKLLFAFGDVNLSNCEDGYVLSDRLRVTAETTLCRRINFSCRSRVTFVSRMTLEYTNDSGLRVHVGTFTSAEQPIHFYNIGGNAQLHRDDERRCELYILWNASYVQLPFAECGRVDAAIVRRYRSPSAATRDALLREEREYAESPVAESIVELHRRNVRVVLRVSGVRQTLKLQNSFGQKGVAHYSDLSDFVTNRGESVDLVSSMYSLLGRFACGQLLEQRSDDGSRRIFSRRTGMCVGVGGHGYFFVSDDSAHNNFIYSVKHCGENPMRVCKLTYDSFLENNLSSSALVKASEFESGVTNPYAGIPRNVIRALDCYGVYDKRVRLESQTLLHTRRRLKDAIVLESIERSDREKNGRRKRTTADDSDVVVCEKKTRG